MQLKIVQIQDCYNVQYCIFKKNCSPKLFLLWLLSSILVFPQAQNGYRKWMVCEVKKVPGLWKRPWAVGRHHWVMPCGAAQTFTVTSSFASPIRDSWSSPAGMNHTGATLQRTGRVAPRPVTSKKPVCLMPVLFYHKNLNLSGAYMDSSYSLLKNKIKNNTNLWHDKINPVFSVDNYNLAILFFRKSLN